MFNPCTRRPGCINQCHEFDLGALLNVRGLQLSQCLWQCPPGSPEAAWCDGLDDAECQFWILAKFLLTSAFVLAKDAATRPPQVLAPHIHSIKPSDLGSIGGLMLLRYKLVRQRAPLSLPPLATGRQFSKMTTSPPLRHLVKPTDTSANATITRTKVFPWTVNLYSRSNQYAGLMWDDLFIISQLWLKQGRGRTTLWV